MKVGTIGNVYQNLPDRLCRNLFPSILDSGYQVSYSLYDYAAEFIEGGVPLLQKERVLDFKKTRNIGKREDCALQDVLDEKDCTVYLLINSMTQTKWPDLPDYNFYLNVPYSIAEYEKVMLKFSKVSW